MTFQDFRQTVKVYKSHKLKNDFISVTYVNILNSNTSTTERTIEIPKNGGALQSLYHYLCNSSR